MPSKEAAQLILQILIPHPKISGTRLGSDIHLHHTRRYLLDDRGKGMSLRRVPVDRCIVVFQVERRLLVVAGYSAKNSGAARENANSRHRHHPP